MCLELARSNERSTFRGMQTDITYLLNESHCASHVHEPAVVASHLLKLLLIRNSETTTCCSTFAATAAAYCGLLNGLCTTAIRDRRRLRICTHTKCMAALHFTSLLCAARKIYNSNSKESFINIFIRNCARGGHTSAFSHSLCPFCSFIYWFCWSTVAVGAVPINKWNGKRPKEFQWNRQRNSVQFRITLNR